MKLHEFYSKYANVPLTDRFMLLSNDYSSQLMGMTLTDVYHEIRFIDDKLLADELRREKLLEAVGEFLTNNK